MKRYLRILLTAYICLLAIWLCLPTSDNARSVSRPSTPVRNLLLGTWKGEHGVIIEMRQDGTTRSRSLDDESNAIRYSGYRQVGDQLFIDYIAKPEQYWRRIRQAFSGTNNEHFTVVTLTNNEFELIDVVSGKRLSFSRTEDKLVSEAK